MSDIPRSVIDIRSTFGAAFIGLVVSTMLSGLTIAQTWIYFWNYQNRDSKAFMFFIAFITIMDALHTIMCAYTIYWQLILKFGQVVFLGSIWALNLQVILSIIIGTSVEFYYARRIYKLSESIICPIIIVVLNTIGASIGLLFAIKELDLKQFSSVQSLTWLASAGLAAGIISELVVAGAMCWSLYHKRTGFARTDSIINALIIYTINSGFLTSVLGIASTVSFIVYPYSLIGMAFYWTMSKCFVTSLLAMLNSRDRVCFQPNTEFLDTAFNSSSTQIERSNDVYGSKSGQRGLSITTRRSTISNCVRSKYDHGVETRCEIPTLDSGIMPSRRGQTSQPSV